MRAADERAPLHDLLATDPTVAGRQSLASLDTCFDDAAFLKYVPAVIGRLDALSTDLEARRSRAGLAAATGEVPHAGG
jgi:hypothetical protein